MPLRNQTPVYESQTLEYNSTLPGHPPVSHSKQNYKQTEQKYKNPVLQDCINICSNLGLKITSVKNYLRPTPMAHKT